MSRPAPPAPIEGYICIGAITQPHGIYGEVRVHLFNPDSNTLFEVEELWLRMPGRKTLEPCQIVEARDHTKGVLLKLEGCDTRNQAETKRKAELYVAQANLPQLEEGEFYFYQLEGMPVFSTQGEALGEISRVMPGAAQDLLVLSYKGREVMIPIVDEFVHQIDIENKRIEIHVIPGLLDG